MAFLLRKEEVDDMLRGKAAEGKRLLEPLKTASANAGAPFNILEDHRVSNEAEVHVEDGDLWYCLEGEALFIHGGKLHEPRCKKNPDGSEDCRELKSREIRGGEQTVLKAGDWLWIPPGEPHQHAAEDTTRLAIIKIPAKHTH